MSLILYLVQCLQCAVPNIYLSCKHKVHRCCGPVQSEGAQRDILLLDIALDSYFRTCVERTDRSSLQGDEIIELVTLVLKNAIIASENEDLAQVWRLVQSGGQQQLWELLLSCQRTPSLLLNMRPWHRPISWQISQLQNITPVPRPHDEQRSGQGQALYSCAKEGLSCL